MNRFFKPIFSGLLAGTLFLGMFSLAGCGGSGKTVLYVDAGGQSGNYNTSVLTGYDTLEELANEWNATNDQFEIVINRYSLNGGRDSIVVGLEGGTAPDILFQIVCGQKDYRLCRILRLDFPAQVETVSIRQVHVQKDQGKGAVRKQSPCLGAGIGGNGDVSRAVQFK